MPMSPENSVSNFTGVCHGYDRNDASRGTLLAVDGNRRRLLALSMSPTGRRWKFAGVHLAPSSAEIHRACPPEPKMEIKTAFQQHSRHDAPALQDEFCLRLH